MLRLVTDESDILPLVDDILPDGKGLLVMLKAYLDRGARKDADGVMCVAAGLFKPARYKPFVRAWNRMLKSIGPSGKPYFHATDFFPGGGIYQDVSNPERAEIAKGLPDLIDAYVHQVVSVSFKEDEFKRVAPIEWRQRFGSLHAVAAQMCATAIGHWANEVGYNGKMAYLFESGDDDESDVCNRFVGISANAVTKRHTRYCSHSFVDKGVARGLEVADYFAWQWNKRDAETISRRRTSQKVRVMRKDFQSLVLRNERKYRAYRFTGQPLASASPSASDTNPPPCHAPVPRPIYVIRKNRGQ